MRAPGCLLLALLLLPACAHYDPYKQPAKRLSYWGGLPRVGPLESKVLPVPPEVVDYVNRDNEVQGFPDRPTAAELTADFKADVVKAVSELPVAFQEQVSRRLYGIFVVNDLGGTAFTDTVFSEDRKTVGTFVLLDRKMIDRAANAWAAWKETTPFRPEAGWELSLRLERDADNTRANAIQYILMHEFGHVLASSGGVHPSWSAKPKEDPPSAYPFSKLSWTVGADGKYRSLYDGAFPERRNILYYFGDPATKPPMSSAPAVYAKLERTGFATLYAATNPFDDFADSLASYLHVIALRKPWTLEIRHGAELVKAYGACWTEKRCAEKRAFLEEYLR